MRRFFAHSTSAARSAAGAEAVRARQLVAELAEQQRLRRQEPADAVGREVAELAERGGVEGAGAHTARTERREPRP